MGIPVFMTQIFASSTDWVQSGAGSVQAIPQTGFYYLQTGKTSAGNGRSFLSTLGSLLSASSGSVTWTVTMTADLKVKFAHNSGSAIDLNMDRALAYALGFDLPIEIATPGLTYTWPGVTSSGVTCSMRSYWLWCPEMLISTTGPRQFDPMVSPGVKTSAGSAHRSPDSTLSYVSNGTVTSAVIGFKGVDGYKRAMPALLSGSWLREDCQTWWENGPAIGRLMIMWRDKSRLIGYSAPFTSNSQPLYYVEYGPDDALRAEPSIIPSAPQNLVFHDITLGLWKTALGEVTYS